MRATVYCGVSLDGFLARADGSVDFLDGHGDPGSDMGFGAHLASVDALVMGRNTFDFVMAAGVEWPYGATPVIVLTRRDLGLPEALRGTVEAFAGSPEATVGLLRSRGCEHAYIDGGQTVHQFLEAGLIDEMIVTIVPVLIGSGIPLFAPFSGDRPLRHVSTETFPNGMVQSRYQVLSGRLPPA